jgi:hypothetical protein
MNLFIYMTLGFCQYTLVNSIHRYFQIQEVII